MSRVRLPRRSDVGGGVQGIALLSAQAVRRLVAPPSRVSALHTPSEGGLLRQGLVQGAASLESHRPALPWRRRAVRGLRGSEARVPLAGLAGRVGCWKLEPVAACALRRYASSTRHAMRRAVLGPGLARLASAAQEVVSAALLAGVQSGSTGLHSARLGCHEGPWCCCT